MGAISLCPQLLQFCMAFGGVAGVLGFIQSSCGTVINVLHCTFWGGTWIDDCIMPIFNELGIGGGKE